MELALLWIQLAVAAGVILVAATSLAKSADIIAFKTGLGRGFAGVILLATATSLPELGTGVTSVTVLGQPDLAAGDAFGSNLFNLLIVGLLDVFWRDGPILRSITPTAVLVGALGIAAVSVAGMAIVIHQSTDALSGWYISPLSAVLLLVLLVGMYLIYRASKEQEQESPQHEDDQYESDSLGRAVLFYTVAATFVIAAAIWLAFVGDRITEEMGWEASFVGTQFLAISTSLPELAASFAAIRINAPELAITNVLGSNLFNMGFVLFIDDAAYTDGVLWTVVSDIHVLTAAIAVIMTTVVIVAMVGHRRERLSKYLTIESVMLIGLYAAASVLVFKLG